VRNHKKSFVSWATLILLYVSSLLKPSPIVAQWQTDAALNEQQPAKPQARFIKVGTVWLCYVEKGTGQPVVLIHGNAGDLHDFDLGALNLIARHHHIIAFDLPGHGSSTMPKKAQGTIEEAASILHDALVGMGIKTPILVGHSWGTAVALSYMVHYPQDVSGLVLLAPVAYPDHRREMQLEGLLSLPVIGDAMILLAKPLVGRRLIERSLKRAFFPDKVPEEYLRAAVRRWLGRRQIRVCIQNDRVLERSLARQSVAYAKIRAPVIIVTGDSDLMVSPAENAFVLHRAIPGSELVVVSHAGHQIPQTHPEVVLQAVQMVRPEREPSSTGINEND